jgi:PHP family Zn ribbon phosphoesterase
MKLKYDLHIHSCVSPCGDDKMTPAVAAGMARLAGLDIAALSDHNTTRNCPAFLKAAEAYGILGIPAMELTTSEEAHILCLLPSLKAAEEFDRYVYERISGVKNRPEIFGNQYVCDADDNIIEAEEKLLIAATSIGVYDVVGLLRSFGGVAIPAHIDRSSFSVLSNLGFIRDDMGFEAVEVSRSANLCRIHAEHSEICGMPYIINSDAHRPEDIPDAENTMETEKITVSSVIESIRFGCGLPRI